MTQDEEFDRIRAELDEIMKHLLTEKRVRTSDKVIIANDLNNKKKAQDPKWHKNQKEGCKRRSDNPSWHQKKKEANERLSKDPQWVKEQTEKNQRLSKDPNWLANRPRGEKNVKFKGVTIGTDVKTGEVKYRFIGSKQMEDMKFSPGNISACILGKMKTYKGCVWHREPIKK